MRVPSLCDWHISLSCVSRLRFPLKLQHFLSFKANAIAMHVSHFVYPLLYVSFISNLCVCVRVGARIHSSVYMCAYLCVYMYMWAHVCRGQRH